MTKEEYASALRLVGHLQAAESVLKEADKLIPHKDKRTSELLAVARHSLDKAILSAWEQAELSATLERP